MSESAPIPPAPPEAAVADPWVGSILGAYRILRPLGRGAMGTVYLAEHLRIGSAAAIKLLHAELRPTSVQRFLTEAQAQSRITHPGAARLFDFADATREPAYLVMEYVAGESLRERLQRGPLPPAAALPVLLQIADTLAAAHAVGVVHRERCHKTKNCGL